MLPNIHEDTNVVGLNPGAYRGMGLGLLPPVRDHLGPAYRGCRVERELCVKAEERWCEAEEEKYRLRCKHDAAAKDGYRGGFDNHHDDDNNRGDDDDGHPSGLVGHTYKFNVTYLA